MDDLASGKPLEERKLPDNSTVYIGAQKFKCPEMLFTPSLAGTNFLNGGIHEQAFSSIKDCDEDINRDLFMNVVLCCGSSLFPKIKPS
jgi:actin-related protein